jgi:eukaryotic-like serine/threonine-protein kinase
MDQLLRQAAHVSEHAPSSRRLLPVGTTLARGRLSVLRRIGEGGMGVVYEAFDTERKTRVALKTLNRRDGGDVYQLKNEFRALADVTHPNLVGLHELFAEGDTWFFTMDLVPGERFDAWVRPGQPGALDERRLREALPALVEAVRAIHAAGKLHRDLKPSNVLITPEGHLSVLDFGLAVDSELGGAGHTLDDHSVTGTPGYMAPEQAAGAPVSSASDSYGIGVMLFEALTGRLPFEGRVHEILFNKQWLNAPSPSACAEHVPADLEALCMQLLARDPLARPCLSAVGASLGAASGPREQPAARRRAEAPQRLLGRDHELTELRLAFEASCQGGKPVVLLLSGESGIGKSALVDALLSELRGAGHALVLSGRCFERESVPFKAFDAVVDELSRYLRRLPAEQVHALLPRDAFALRTLFPVLARVTAIGEAPARDVSDPHELRRRAFLAFGELLGRIRDRQPLVLHLDDLQWSDADSTVLLMHLVRQPDAPRLLLIASHRSEQMREHPCLKPLYGELPIDIRLDVRRLGLGPLPAGAVRALLREQLGELPAQLLEEAAGNPFLLRELARHAAAHPGRTTELSLRSAIVTRVSALPADQRQVLELLAVAARPIPVALAAEAARVDRGPRTVFEGLRSEHLARATGDGSLVECFHDKVREAVLGMLPGAALREHHEALARVLSATPETDPEQLAGHLLGAGASQQAAEQLVRAAERAYRELGFDRAARLYAQALAHGQFSAAQVLGLQSAQADALAEAGRALAAAEAYVEARAGAPPEAHSELALRAAEQCFYAGELARGLELLEAALRPLGIRVPTSTTEILLSIGYHDARLKLRNYRWRGAAAVKPELARRIDVLKRTATAIARIDVPRGIEFGLRAACLELRAGTQRDAASALARLVLYTRLLGGDAEAVKRAVDRADPLVRASDDLNLQTAYHLARGIAWSVGMLAIDPEGALREFERCDEGFAKHAMPGSSYNRNLVQWDRAHMRTSLGEFAAVAAELPAHLDDAWNRGDVCLVPLWAGLVSPLAWLAVGNEAGVEHELAKATALWKAPQVTLQEVHLVFGRHRLHLYRGDMRAAWELFAPWIRERLLRSPLSRSVWAETALHARGQCAAALASELKQGAERQALLDSVTDSARWVRDPSLKASLSAALACQQGDVARATEALRVSGYGSSGLRVAQQATRRRFGVLLGGEAGQTLVREADAFFHKGGVVDVERYVAMLVPGLQMR